jgi:hypothetical protein
MSVRLKFIAVPAVWLYLFVFVHVAAAGPSSDVCDLPKDLQSILERKYPGAKVVGLSDLSEYDKQLFREGHADSCPGLVKVDFYGDGKPTLALALTTKSQDNAVTRLVLARQIGANWQVATLDKAEGPIPVLWTQKPGEYKGVYGKKIRATRPVIIFCGYSSWAVLYAWTNNRTTKIWLRD